VHARTVCPSCGHRRSCRHKKKKTAPVEAAVESCAIVAAALRARGGSVTTREAVVGAVLQSVAQQTPKARELVARRYNAPTDGARPARTDAEWTDIVRHAFPASSPTAQPPVGDEYVDQLARVGGWAQAPLGERMARYATVYAAPDTANAFLRMGWLISAELDDRIAAYKQRHSVVPIRTLQALAHYCADANSAQ
jgi:hypothetical protein